MSRRSPYRIELSPEERDALERRARRQTATRREVFRAQIVVLAATGLRNDEIAAQLNRPGFRGDSDGWNQAAAVTSSRTW